MTPITDITGTSLQGSLEISYNKLIKIFGEPHVKRTAPFDTRYNSRSLDIVTNEIYKEKIVT